MTNIIIGSGNYGNAAIKVSDHCDISENHVSYWSSVPPFSYLFFIIFKDTREGKIISKLIDKGQYYRIDNFVYLLFLKTAPATLLKKLIADEIKNAYDDGKIYKQNEIKEVLGMF